MYTPHTPILGSHYFVAAIVLAMSFTVGLFMFVPHAQAANQKSSTVSDDYTITLDRGLNEDGGGGGKWYLRMWVESEQETWVYHNRPVATGEISVTHVVDVKGSLKPKVGENVDFIYTPESPFFFANGGNWGTPYGAWCDSIQTRSDECGSGKQRVISRAKGRGKIQHPADVYWSAVKPDISMTSSDPSVISCDGMECTAVGQGRATVTANIGKTETRAAVWIRMRSSSGGNFWWWLTERNRSYILKGSHWGIRGWWNRTITQEESPRRNTMALDPTAISWDVEVKSGKPAVTLTASPNPVTHNTSSTLTWNVSNADQCSASGDWSGSKSTSGGEEDTGNLTSNKTYRIQCTNDHGSAQDAVTVRANDPTECNDDIDNDGDGWIDYGQDPGCDSLEDDDESDRGNTQCSDGIDNDGDGLIDGNDPHCLNANDDNEAPEPDFSLTKTNNIGITIVGDSTSSSNSTVISADATETFGSSINLSVLDTEPSIPDIQYAWDENSTLTPNEYQNEEGDELTVTVPGSTQAGEYIITIQGEGGGLTRTIDVLLNVERKDPQFENI